MNGKRGDHPLTDLFVHGLPVFSPPVGALLREIRGLAGDREWRHLEDSINWFRPPPDEELREQAKHAALFHHLTGHNPLGQPPGGCPSVAHCRREPPDDHAPHLPRARVAARAAAGWGTVGGT